MRFLLATVFTVVLLLSTFQPVEAARIEAVKGKKYRLTEQHGPWMIMVATFREPPEQSRVAGKSPAEAAEELVYELRRRGIPAYSFRRDEAKGLVRTKDRMGRDQNRVYTLDEEICVIAGNYSDTENSTGQKTLAWIKKFEPKCLEEGGIYRKTPGRPGPLSGAFLTINPLLSPEEVQRKKRDPLILKLNSGFDHSLLTNKGDKTVLVASFYGSSQTQVSDNATRKIHKTSVKDALSPLKETNNLDKAGLDAWRVTQSLRIKGYEAYVFHDRYKSIVTVGAFPNQNAGAVGGPIKVQKEFGAKWKRDPDTKQMKYTPETLILPGLRKGDPAQVYVFDSNPKVIDVPKYD